MHGFNSSKQRCYLEVHYIHSMLNVCTDGLCVVLAAREAFKKPPKTPLYFSDGD